MDNLAILLHKILKIRIVRFLLVGGLNTLFGFTIYVLFILFGFKPTIAVAIATILGAMFNFKTIGWIVFKRNEKKLIFKFIIMYVLVYIVNVYILRMWISYGISKILAQALSLPISVCLSYTLSKRWVFFK